MPILKSAKNSPICVVFGCHFGVTFVMVCVCAYLRMGGAIAWTKGTASLLSASWKMEAAV